MMNKTTPRVFLGLRETAGYFSGLREGLTQLGVSVTQIDLSDDPHGYVDRSHGLQRLGQAIAKKRTAARQPIERAFWLLIQGILATWALGSAIPRHDAFIFGVHNRAFTMIVYPLLRVAGKRVITVLHGSAVRPAYLNVKSVGAAGAVDPSRLRRQTQAAKSRLAIVERLSHQVVNQVPIAQFATRPFVDFLAIGFPSRAPTSALPRRADDTGQSVRILHAPSDKAAKGTLVIREAIEKLRSTNLPIDYVEISGRPHAEVLDELSRADLVIDQAYSDQPMPGFATEAAAHGVPVVIGSEDWAGAIPRLEESAIPPTIRVHPRELATVVGELVMDPNRRDFAAQTGRDFVRSRWSPAAVASRYLRVIQNDIPEEWVRTPADVRYVHGVGLPESRLAEAVAALVDSFGVQALGLDHSPDVRDRLVALAKAHTKRPVRAT
jgi:hypothetical protein